MAFIEITGVSKTFGGGPDRAHVLEDINLTIDEGEFIAIVGFSGSGKTTLMSILAGLLRADTGSVRVAGREVQGAGPDRALVFQSYALPPWLTVFENVALAVDAVFRGWPKQKRRRHVEEHIALVGLEAATHKKPGELSGGMRQRVAVARALAMKPEILLLDEPLGALDALTRATLQREIERIWLANRKTVVMITNDVDEAILLADRIVPMSVGPGATLGPAVKVEIERPRDRKALNHDARFKALRNQVIEYLLGPGRRRDGADRSAAPVALATASEVGPGVAA